MLKSKRNYQKVEKNERSRVLRRSSENSYLTCGLSQRYGNRVSSVIMLACNG